VTPRDDEGVSPRRVLLIGMMGSGKTSVGRAVSERTGWPYHDNDDVLAEQEGLPTEELARQRGEQALREAESRALQALLAKDPPLVAGVAAGVVEMPADRERLAGPDAFVVYLHTPIEVLVERVGSGEGRPWLQPDPEAALRKLQEGREDHYRAAADLVVDSSTGRPEDHAAEIVAALD
jgi:shikimate kinase